MAVENIIKFLPRDAVAFLRIADSDARFPIRPISEGSFLIGHGTACDLRLGDHEVPALHSILRVTSASASIALMAERPELVVNGETVSRAVLCDGDLVEIGDVRLVFRFVSDKATSGSALALPPLSDEAETAVDVTPSTELSATELVSGLEQEFKLLNELQETTVDSIDRLLNAARRSVEGASIKLATPPLRVVGMDERFLASDRDQLQEIAAKVRQQESRLSGVCHVLEQIVAQQQIMTTALQSVADRLTEVRAAIQTETASARRVSA